MPRPLRAPPPPTTESHSVSKQVVSLGMEYTVTLSAEDAKIFDENYLSINKKNKYVRVDAKGRCRGTTTLHRLVFTGAVPKGMVVDHIDQNPLNNVRSNLRVLSRSDNAMNTSLKKRSKAGYRGVTKNGSKFAAELRGTSIGGAFPSAKLAKAYRIRLLRQEGSDAMADLETEVELTKSDEEFLDGYKRRRRGSPAGEGHIERKYGAFYPSLRHKRLGRCETEEEAREKIRQEQQRLKEEEAKEAAIVVIPRTAEGFAYLTGKNGERILVDDDIYMQFRKNKVCLSHGYPVVLGKALHHIVCSRQDDHVIDHINGNKLDARRANLRNTSYSTNNRNRKASGVTGYLGVLRYAADPTMFQAVVVDTRVVPPAISTQVFKHAADAARWRQERMWEIYPEDRAVISGSSSQ